MDRAEKLTVLHRDLEYKRKSLGYVLVGACGEMVVFSKRNETPPDALWVLSEQGSFHLVPDRAAVGETEMDISPDGRITQGCLARTPAGPASPELWPFRDKENALCVPQGVSVLTKVGELKATDMAAPPHVIGWVFLARSGDMFVLSKDAKPFENILWIVRREDGGLDFTHAGPLKKGVYMSVGRDRRVKYIDSSTRTDAKSESIIWPVHDEDGLPTIDLHTRRIPRNPAELSERTVQRDGYVIIREKTCVD